MSTGEAARVDGPADDSWSQGPGVPRIRRQKRPTRVVEADPAPGEAMPLRCPPLVAPDLALYPLDLDAKVARAKKILAPHLPGLDSLQVVPSPEPLHYRHRVKFPVRLGSDGEVAFSIFDPENEKWVDVKDYPIASKRINRLMVDLLEFWRTDIRSRDEVFQVELLSNTEGDALVCAMYRKPFDVREALAIGNAMAQAVDAGVVLRAKGQRFVAPCRDGFLTQVNEVQGRLYPQRLLETGFFQANLKLNREMQLWVVEQAQEDSARLDLLELYCGNGNFTLPAASVFRGVLATELDQLTLSAAQTCAREAEVRNVKFLKAKAESIEMGRGLTSAYRFTTLMVDPPRAGLDKRCLKVAADLDSVLYISCNPLTLARDLALLPEHKVVSATLFDQFPWTDHAEVTVRLQRRT